MKLAFEKKEKNPVTSVFHLWRIKRKIKALELIRNEYEKDLEKIGNSNNLASFLIKECISLTINELQPLYNLVAR